MVKFTAYIFIFLAMTIGQSSANLHATILETLVKHLMFPRPLPLLYDTQRETKISLIKATSKKDLSLNWISKQPYSEQNLLVLFKNTNETEKININQQIYILNFGLQLLEKYVINNQVIERKLGHFVGKSYVPEELIEESFLKRRMNFNGSTIIALTEKEQTTIILENLDKAPFFLSNQTYDVTNFVCGSFYDIWKRLEEQLNFTTKLYKRKDGKWGVPNLLSNGSLVIPNGIVRDVMTSQADIALASLSMLYNRYLAIDFLHPIVQPSRFIFIKKDLFKVRATLSVLLVGRLANFPK